MKIFFQIWKKKMKDEKICEKCFKWYKTLFLFFSRLGKKCSKTIIYLKYLQNKQKSVNKSSF